MIYLNEECSKYVGQARVSDPEGTYCGRCGLTNYKADDCGWFVVDNKCLCHGCYDKSGHTTAER